MLRLDDEQYQAALEKMVHALAQAETANVRTHFGRCDAVLQALGNDFDVSALDPGPREDIESGSVWGCEYCGAEDHDRDEHMGTLMERITAEIREHNHRLLPYTAPETLNRIERKPWARGGDYGMFGGDY